MALARANKFLTILRAPGDVNAANVHVLEGPVGLRPRQGGDRECRRRIAFAEDVELRRHPVPDDDVELTPAGHDHLGRRQGTERLGHPVLAPEHVAGAAVAGARRIAAHDDGARDDPMPEEAVIEALETPRARELEGAGAAREANEVRDAHWGGGLVELAPDRSQVRRDERRQHASRFRIACKRLLHREGAQVADGVGHRGRIEIHDLGSWISRAARKRIRRVVDPGVDRACITARVPGV